MKTKMMVVLVVLIALSLPAWGRGVKYVKTWKNPEAQPGTWKGKKVLALVKTRLTDARQGAEQALVQELQKLGIQGVEATSLVPPGAEKDRDAARRILTEAGIAGALVMQVLEVRGDNYLIGGQAYIPGSVATSAFYSSWEGGWSGAYAPTNIGTETTLVVETLVYSVDQDKLVWRGTSETTNPKEVGDTMQKLVTATGKQLKKAGLVAK